MSIVHRWKGSTDPYVPGEKSVFAFVYGEQAVHFTEIPTKLFRPQDLPRMIEQRWDITLRVCPRAARARLVSKPAPPE